MRSAADNRANTPPRPAAWLCRWSAWFRQFFTASSSRQNDSDRSLPGSVSDWNRSTEMKPSIFSKSGFSFAAIVEIVLLAAGGGPHFEDHGDHRVLQTRLRICGESSA